MPKCEHDHAAGQIIIYVHEQAGERGRRDQCKCLASTFVCHECERETVPDLKWKLLTKKRGSSTQGLPPGKEDLAWVTNTVTLIYGERDATLVDTFLSVQ